MTDQNSDLLARISQQLEDHIQRYDRDVTENKERFGQDREERRIWREAIDDKFDGIERRIAPIVLHHQIIVKGGSWIVASFVGVFGMVKAWFFIKEHL